MKILFQTWMVSVLIISTGILKAQTKPLSLHEALQLASKGNRQLQIKWLESEKATEAVKEAQSFLLPSVAANGSYNIYGERPVIYLRNEVASPKLNDVKFGGRFAFDANINASYPLLNPVLKSNVRLTGFHEKISRQEIKATAEDLALTISQLYLSILMNKEQQAVLSQSLLRNEQALNDSRSLFLQGKSLKTDTLSNYISVQNLKAGIAALESNYAVLSVQLKQLMGIEDGSEFTLTDSLGFAGEKLNITSTGLSIALENRTDVQMQALRIDQSKEMCIM